jgi:hypothetical protein
MLFTIAAGVISSALMLLVLLFAIAALIMVRSYLTDRILLGLALLSCFLALIFVPLLRTVPEQVSLLLFLVGFWPILSMIAAAVIASTVRVVQTRRKESLFSLILSIVAAVLFYINGTTPLLWPYRTQ